LEANRESLNVQVLAKVKEVDFTHDLWAIVEADVELGAQGEVPMLDELCDPAPHCTRFIPVREQREGKWRTRGAAH
jgi:hypothetical protein